MTFVCPCCGSAIEAPPSVDALAELVAGPVGGNILAALIGTYPKGLTIQELVTRVYDGAREPEYAASSLTVIIGKMRDRLATHGWSIPKVGHGSRGALYRLVPLKGELNGHDNAPVRQEYVNGGDGLGRRSSGYHRL